MTPIELLAPARNADIGIAAIRCGADAVYIAGPEFGARKDAGNPVSEIERLCAYAHRYGARVFVTFNILLREDELERSHAQMLACQSAGADAFIIRDPRICLWEDIVVPLHASTQCAIRDAARAREFEAAGCSRIILERELSLEQIRSICAAVSCEVECFVHGALCVSYSGQCTLSQAITGRSADRGECIQACRNLYDLEDTEGRVLMRSKALLSLKDLNLEPRLEELLEAGVSSLKIEGRLKNESYVKNVVRSYDLRLRSLGVPRASFGFVEDGFEPDVDRTFNRGYTQLYLDGRRGSWASMDAPKSMGEELGRVAAVRRKGPSEMLVELEGSGHELRNGDGFAFVRGNSIVGFRGDVCQGNRITAKAVEGLKAGMTLYRNLSAAFEKSLEARPCERLLKVSLSVEASDGELRLKARCEDGREAALSVPYSETALNQQRAEAMLCAQLGKRSGCFSFELLSLEGSLPHLRAASINALRRELAAAIDAQAPGSVPLLNLRTGGVSAEAVSALLPVRVSAPGELMRSKYCIRHELGLCPKQCGKPAKDLVLVNNGRRFTVRFDCRNCEMVLI